MQRTDRQQAAAAGGPDGPGPGTVLAARFELRELLGEGAIGRVWSALDRQLGDEVAVKVLRPELSASAEVVARFEREARLARRVTHPGVCRTHDQGRDERFGPFITMERLAGETLAERLERYGPWEPQAALRLLADVADALAAAHAAGVVHRDLKTANVLLVADGDGVRPVLTDFGLARSALVDSDGAATRSGDIVGSPAYMAPEQVRGEPVQPATDVYSLGIIAFELVTGELPFQGGSALGTAIQRLEREPPAPSTRRPGLDPRWDAAVLRALAREPADRYADPRELARALADGDKVGAEPADDGAAHRKRRYFAAAAVLLGLAVVFLALRSPDGRDALPGPAGGRVLSFAAAEPTPVAVAGPAASETALQPARLQPPGPQPAEKASDPVRTEAEAALAAGNDLFRSGEVEAARARYEEAVAGFRAVGDAGKQAAALNNLGNTLAVRGELTAATPYYRSALELHRTAGDPEKVQRTLFSLGRHLFRTGDFPAAQTAFEELLVEARRHGDEGLTAQGLLALAALLHLRGDLGQAERALREALVLRRGAGASVRAVASVERELGLVLARQGRLAAARPLLESALVDFRAEEQGTGAASVLDGLGELLARLGEGTAADAALAEAEEIWRTGGHRAAAARTAVARARLAAEQGRLAEARRHLDPALAALSEIGGSEGRHEALAVAGELARLAGDLDAARRLHGEALELRHGLGSVLGEVESLCALAAVALDGGLPAEAEALARSAAADARAAGAGDLALAAELLLARALVAGARVTAARELLAPRLPPQAASEAPALRLETALVAAWVDLAAGETGQSPALAALEQEARRARRPALAYEAAVLRAAAEAREGDVREAARRLGALGDEARTAGYLGVSARAEAAASSSAERSLKLAGSMR